MEEVVFIPVPLRYLRDFKMEKSDNSFESANFESQERFKVENKI